ncbi:MAG: hypothetical protein PHN66_02230 [Candidatus Shapirobacteria bacterium]|nr:hypothetical protein [Candidatus Shapirobacteria bacterium]
MTERIPSAIKGMNISDAISQTFQNQAIERFNRNRTLHIQNKKTTDEIISKLKSNINPKTKFTIFEKPKNPQQSEAQIDITNIEITNTSVIFSRSDNPEKQTTLNYLSFCILTKLVNRNSNGLLKENFDITSQWQLLPTTPKLDQTS